MLLDMIKSAIKLSLPDTKDIVKRINELELRINQLGTYKEENSKWQTFYIRSYK